MVVCYIFFQLLYFQQVLLPPNPQPHLLSTFPSWLALPFSLTQPSSIKDHTLHYCSHSLCHKYVSPYDLGSLWILDKWKLLNSRGTLEGTSIADSHGITHWSRKCPRSRANHNIGVGCIASRWALDRSGSKRSADSTS